MADDANVLTGDDIELERDILNTFGEVGRPKVPRSVIGGRFPPNDPVANNHLDLSVLIRGVAVGIDIETNDQPFS